MMWRLMATRGRSSPSASDRWADFIFWLTVLIGVIGTVWFFSSLQKGGHRLTVGTFLKNGMHEERLAANNVFKRSAISRND